MPSSLQKDSNKQKLHVEQQRKEISLKFRAWGELRNKICLWRLKQKYTFSGMFFARAQAKVQKGKYWEKWEHGRLPAGRDAQSSHIGSHALKPCRYFGNLIKLPDVISPSSSEGSWRPCRTVSTMSSYIFFWLLLKEELLLLQTKPSHIMSVRFPVFIWQFL